MSKQTRLEQGAHLLKTRLTKAGNYLLNDNVALQGPWFDSVEWPEGAWLPHARRIGLRYIAHVVQSDTRVDILTRTFLQPIVGAIDLQLFPTVVEAEEWLRQCVTIALLRSSRTDLDRNDREALHRTICTLNYKKIILCFIVNISSLPFAWFSMADAYLSFDPGATINGETLRTLLASFQFPRLAGDMLTRYGLPAPALQQAAQVQQEGLKVGEHPLAGLVAHDGIALSVLAEATDGIFEINVMRNQGHCKRGKTNHSNEGSPAQKKGTRV